jgi:H+/Cl- antiporter ClcA
MITTQIVTPVRTLLAVLGLAGGGMAAVGQTGTGLTGFAKRFPDRFFDVGIAEAHAMVFAAGLAAGFKAPIAGVFFAFEGSFSAIPGRPSLRAVLVASVASALVTQLILGDTPILRLPAYEVRSPLELPLYLGLGLLASLMSWLLVRLLALGRDVRLQRFLSQLPTGLPTALGGAAVGGMALAFPQVLGVGYDTIEALLGSDEGIPLLTLGLLIAFPVISLWLPDLLAKHREAGVTYPDLDPDDLNVDIREAQIKDDRREIRAKRAAFKLAMSQLRTLLQETLDAELRTKHPAR